MSDALFDDSPALGPAFTASFDSDDACCGQGIEEGEEIRADGEGGWIHVECSVKSSRQAVKTCPQCFLTYSASGECGC